MEDHEKIELRSEKVRNIIGRIPPILIRSGISFMSVIIFALLLAAWFVPYPESLRIRCEIISADDHSLQAVASAPYSFINRIKKQMPVKIETEGYNPSSFGYTDGNIISMDDEILTRDGQNFFTIYISISPGSIPLKEKMKGQAIVLLSDKSLLKHILGSISF